MKKSILALALTVLLTGCQTAAPATSETANPVAQAETVQETTAETAEKSAENATEKTAETSKKEASLDVEALAQELAELPVGTAGSSLKIVALANEFLPGGQALKEDPSTFITAFRNKAKKLDEGEIEELFAMLSLTVENLIKEDKTTLNSLKDAGEKLNTSSLSAKEWKTLLKEIQEKVAQ